MTQKELTSYSQPAVVLYGDDSNEEHSLPLKRIAVIPQSDMESLWKALKIEADWLPTDPFGIKRAGQQNFPMLYATQGFIAFEREYATEQLNQLMIECQHANRILPKGIAAHTLGTILNAALLQKSHKGRLLFRAGIIESR